jgi:hypothetical protein
LGFSGHGNKDKVLLDVIRRKLEEYLIIAKKGLIAMYQIGDMPEAIELSYRDNEFIAQLMDNLVKSYIDEENVKFKEILSPYVVYSGEEVGVLAPRNKKERAAIKTKFDEFKLIQPSLVASHVAVVFNKMKQHVNTLYDVSNEYYESMEAIDLD